VKSWVILLFICPNAGCRRFQGREVASVEPAKALTLIIDGFSCESCDERLCFIGSLGV
jgi:hypothetical protein